MADRPAEGGKDGADPNQIGMQQSDPNAPIPPQRPIGSAAAAPVGPSGLTTSNKWVDLLAVIFGPLLVPAAILAAIRSEGFTLGDVAFGVVAVAFASLTRALTGRADSWRLVSAIGVGAVVFETAIAVDSDSGRYSGELFEKVRNCPRTCDTVAAGELAGRIQEKMPGVISWGIVVFFGAVLCSFVGYVIWNET